MRNVTLVERRFEESPEVCNSSVKFLRFRPRFGVKLTEFESITSIFNAADADASKKIKIKKQ
jgi:hypothetical protein